MSGALARLLALGSLVCGTTTSARAQQSIEMYAGGLVGVATLSADARSVVSDGDFSVSLYEPQNGLAVNLLFGAHVYDYISIQGNYIWNRNDLMLVSTQTRDGARSFSQEFGHSTQHMAIGDVLVYFRSRGDRIRPYLSGGVGVVSLKSDTTTRSLFPPDDRIPRNLAVSEARATLRVAVGLDVRIGDGSSIRYSFSENLSDNPISELLTPVGQRNLANFQNLVGVLWSF